jgi:UDP-glucose 4-epimerase
MRALVTGGAGFVGSNLIKRLLEGYDNRVTSLDNYTTGKIENQHKGCKYLHGDIRDYEAWGQFDVIFHMAALPRIGPSFKNPKEVFQTNVLGTQNVLEYAKVYNISVIYAGSSSFHGGVYKNPYTFTKWQGEELCRMYNKLFGVDVTICRFYNVYGDYMQDEGEYRTVLPIFLKQRRNKEPLTITGDGSQRRDFTHVDDIIDAMLLCVDKKVYGETFDLGRGENYGIKELVIMISKLTPGGVSWTHIPKIKGEMKETLCDYAHAAKVLGWKPKRNLEEWLQNEI